jgi:hypothetical protein
MIRSLLIVLLLAGCSDATAPKQKRGDPFTVIVPHIQFTDTLVQQYDLFLAVDEAGPTPPAFSTEGSVDSAQAANGFVTCFALEADSLGARTIWGELRSAFPAAVGDTLRSAVFDPANIPSADSANGYGQSSAKPYYWHWYISNDSSVVRGDTTPVVVGSSICHF